MEKFDIYSSLIAAYFLNFEKFNTNILQSEHHTKQLIAIARFNRLENSLLNFLEKSKLEIPSNLKQQLKTKALKLTIKSASCLESSLRISKILSTESIPFVFLKALAMYTYNTDCISRRPSSDVDVFIPKSEAYDAVKILIQKGYKLKKKYPFNNKYWEGSLDENPDVLLKDNENNSIEIHTSLFKKAKKDYPDFEKSFLESNLVKNKNFVDLRAPSFENYILHVIYNYTTHSFYTSGFKYFLDIKQINMNHDLDWRYILEKSKEIDINLQTYLTINSMVKLELLPRDFLSKNRVPIIEQGYIDKAISLSFENVTSDNYTALREANFLKKVSLIIKKIILPSSSKLSYEYNISIKNKFKLMMSYPLYLVDFIKNYLISRDKINFLLRNDDQHLNKVNLRDYVNNDSAKGHK